MELYDMVDGYYQDIEDGLTQAEPRENESDCGFEEVRQAADSLLSEMRAFRSEEDIDDLSPEAWAEYKSMHNAIQDSLYRIGSSRRTKQPEGVIRGESAHAAASLRNASIFFRRERARLAKQADVQQLLPEKQGQERQKWQLRKAVKRRISRRAKIKRRGNDKGVFDRTHCPP